MTDLLLQIISRVSEDLWIEMVCLTIHTWNHYTVMVCMYEFVVKHSVEHRMH